MPRKSTKVSRPSFPRRGAGSGNETSYIVLFWHSLSPVSISTDHSRRSERTGSLHECVDILHEGVDSLHEHVDSLHAACMNAWTAGMNARTRCASRVMQNFV